MATIVTYVCHAASGIFLGEGNIHPLLPSKGTGPAMGLLKLPLSKGSFLALSSDAPFKVVFYCLLQWNESSPIITEA